MVRFAEDVMTASSSSPSFGGTDGGAQQQQLLDSGGGERGREQALIVPAVAQCPRREEAHGCENLQSRCGRVVGGVQARGSPKRTTCGKKG